MFGSSIFRRTLIDAPQRGDQQYVDKLRIHLEYAREKTQFLAAQIGRDLPYFTVHDVSHCDAIWEVIDTLAGTDYPINPLESYVLGMSILVHDLAMTKSAFPNGFRAIVGEARWNDTVYLHFRQRHGRSPSAAELASPAADVAQAVEEELLRELHAEQAGRLPHTPFRDGLDGAEYFLISDPEIRGGYGELIGRIAASHWWSASELPIEFDSVIGAPAVFPLGWTVDPLKLSCLLRAGDAAHIDSRRAPGFLRAVIAPEGESRKHWIFQERMQRPRLDVDRLVFTSPQPFTPEDADAWWLCVDSLRMIDGELRSCDAILADAGRPRLAARSVAYVDDLARLARQIPVRDWYPIDARVKVNDVVGLVRKLGGEQLYGNKPYVALRELISNAADAVRARRAMQNDAASELRMRVHIALKMEEGESWLTVRDNGLGMSREVMSGPLLDFGTSYWSSMAARRDLPGLLSSGFAPTGKFGIGFFSVFMLGAKVRVTSRRFDQAASNAHVLTFGHGLESRPLLRRVDAMACLPYGGTEVAVQVSDSTIGLLLGKDCQTLGQLCAHLFPSLDVNLDVEVEGKIDKCVEESDWRSLEDGSLLERLYPGSVNARTRSGCGPLTAIFEADGMMVGRAALAIPGPSQFPNRFETITAPIVVDGAISESVVNHAAGVLLGQTDRAARDSAHPLASPQALGSWASGQVQLILESRRDSPLEAEEQIELAGRAYAFGASVDPLIVANSAAGYMSPSRIVEWAKGKTRVRLLQDAAYSVAGGNEIVVDDDVLIVDMGIPTLLGTRAMLSRIDWSIDWLFPGREVFSGSLDSLCAKVVGQAWGAEDQVAEQRVDQIRAHQEAEELEWQVGDGVDDDDEEGPFAEEWGTDPSSQRVRSSVYVLTRSD